MLLVTVALLIATVVSRVTVVTLPGDIRGDGQTYLFIGTDAGVARPAGDPQEGGARADVVILVHRTADRSTAVVVPRDLVVTGGDGAPLRLALVMNDGAGAVAGAVCHSLGVAVDHVVAVGASGFAAAIDRLGGVRISVSQPVRDARADLSVLVAGEQMLDGRETLAFVRSRHPEYLVDGSWVEVDDAVGAAVRSASTAEVMSALAVAARQADGWRQVAAAWAISDGAVVSADTWPGDIADTLSELAPPSVLPTESLGESFRTVGPQTLDSLRASGFAPGCGAR